MALPSTPSKSKTWQYLWNTAVGGTGAQGTDAQSLVYTLKTKLLAMRNAVDGSGNPSGATPIFTVSGSSDRSTAGMDGADRWTDSTKCVFTNGAVGSWIVLKNNGSGLTAAYYVLLSLQSNGTNNYWFVGISYSGFSGGSTTANPTAADLWSPPGNGSAASGTLQLNGITPNASQFLGRVHVLGTTDGTSVRFLFSIGGFTGQAYLLEQLASPTTGWTNPLLVLCSSVAPASLAYTSDWFTNAALLTSTTAIGIRGNPNPTVPTLVTGNLTTVGYSTTYANVIGLPNEVDGSWPMYAIGVFASTTGYRGVLGTVQDLYVVPGSNVVTSGVGIPTGSQLPGDGTRLWTVFGNLALPDNGVVVSVY